MPCEATALREFGQRRVRSWHAGVVKTSVGTKLGPYVLCARLGRGAQGEVWRADGPNGAVALKLVLQRDAETMIRAWREARLQRRARSPHVVEVMDNFVHEGVPVIVMELVDGMSLKEVLRNGRPTLSLIHI